MNNGCCYDAMPSKPLPGRGIADSQQQVCNVTKCGSKRCLTCKHNEWSVSLVILLKKNIK